MAYQNAVGTNAQGSIFYDVSGDQFNLEINEIGHPALQMVDITVADAAYNRPGTRARCLEGTREDVLAKIEQWADGGNDHPICWLNGPAGSGKSAISQSFAERRVGANKLAASFFFFRGAGDRSRVKRFVTTLAYHLAVSVPDTKPFIQSALRSDPLLPTQSLEYQLQKLIIDPVLRLTRRIGPMTVVIDALDECDDKDSIVEFVELITRAFRAHSFPLRFFFTSRAEDHIHGLFESPETKSATFFLNLQDFDAHADIRTFLRSRFSTIYTRNRSFMRDVPWPWPSDSVLKDLVQQSSGSFIFATTLVSFIDDGAGDPHGKLQRILRTDGLDALYAQIFSGARSPHFNQIIETIMLLRKPLTVPELGDLLQLSAADILRALLEIHAILNIPADDGQPVQLIHTSLRDFLTDKRRSRDLFIDSLACHGHIVVSCLEKIKKELGKDMFPCGALLYACRNWWYHLHSAVAMDGGNLNSGLGSFLIRCLTNLSPDLFNSWVNTLILRGDIPQILNILDSVISRLKKFHSSKELLLVIKEIREHIKKDSDDFERWFFIDHLRRPLYPFFYLNLLDVLHDHVHVHLHHDPIHHPILKWRRDQQNERPCLIS